MTKQALLALAIACVCVCAPDAALAENAAKATAAAEFTCHEALLKLHYYPYHQEFGQGGRQGGAQGSRIVKDRSNDELTDIIVIPSDSPTGYWVYERSGDRYFFPVPKRMSADGQWNTAPRFFKLQVGKRAVYINDEARGGMNQPLLQPTAFLEGGRNAYTTVKPARPLDEQAFAASAEHDITSLLNGTCDQYHRELNSGGAEDVRDLAGDRERATKGTTEALNSCSHQLNESISTTASAQYAACGIQAPASAQAVAARDEGERQDRKTVVDPAADTAKSRTPARGSPQVRALDPEGP